MTDEYAAEQPFETPAPPSPLRPAADNEPAAPRRTIPVLPRGPLTANPPNTAQGTPAPAPATNPAPATPASTNGLNAPANTNPALNNPTPMPGAVPPAPGPAAEDPAADPANPADQAGEESPEGTDPGQDPGDPEAPELPFSPQDAIGMATGVAAPAISAALGVPAALLGAGMGLMAPFMAILGQFGQGSPAMPSSSGVPSDVLSSLGGGLDPSSAITGPIADNYQSSVDDQFGKATAMDDLEAKLRGTLERSSSNTTLGREKIEQIIDQVKQTLQQLGPIANTPAGQMGVMSTIITALQQAGAVLGDALSKDSLNAGAVQSMAADFAKASGSPSAHNVSATSPLGGLTRNSTPQQVAAAIIAEARRRGYSPEQTVAILSTAMQESGLKPLANGGGGAWHGIFQQDTSYPGRDNPNTNIAEFFNRLATKGGPASPDIWKSIFWLQQAPGIASAEAAFAGGRQAYLSEIMSQQSAAAQLYRQIASAPAASGRISV